jgi:hypothetical protein
MIANRRCAIHTQAIASFLTIVWTLVLFGLTKTSALALVFTPIPLPPGCASSTGVKINVHGNAAFNATCGATTRSYYYDRLRNIAIALRLPAGASASVAFDINDNNVIVGTSIYNQNGFKRYPTIWSPSGAGRVLPEPTSTDARGVNPRAGATMIVVGQTMIGAALPQAVTIVPAPLAKVPPPPKPGKDSELNDVNDAGIAVGEFNAQAASSTLPRPLAVLRGLPLGQSSVANAINAAGTIVGSVTIAAVNGCPQTGFPFVIAPPGLPVRLPAGGSCVGVAEDINDNGAIVGYVTFKTKVQHAAAFAPNWLDFNTMLLPQFAPLRWKVLTDVSGINNNNEVVGTGVNVAGSYQAFAAL